MKKVIEKALVAAIIIAGLLIFAGAVGATEITEPTGVGTVDPFATLRMATDAMLSRVAHAGTMWDGHWVQTEYIPCILDGGAIWFEDGSAICDHTSFAEGLQDAFAKYAK